MKKRLLIGTAAGVLVLLAHFGYQAWRQQEMLERWTSVGQRDVLLSYLQSQEVLLGLSYGLSAAFFVYAIVAYRSQYQKSGLQAVAGGLTLSGALYAGTCFLLGCCGSPMLGVYLALFGSPFLGLTKLATLVVTLFTVTLGFFWLERRLKVQPSCCDETTECNTKVC